MRPKPELATASLADAPPARSAPIALGRSTLLGALAILVAVGGFGTWAAVVPLASAVIAPGAVTVATKRKLIQHLEGGIVRAIHVRDGDVVRAGAMLLELDITRPRGRFATSRAAYLAALAAEARLVAERDQKPAIRLPADLAQEATRDPEIAAVVAAQHQLFAARQTEIEGQTAILNQRIGRLHEEIAGFAVERAAAERQLNMATAELGTLEGLFSQGYTTRTRVLSIRREQMQLEGTLGRLAAQIARSHKEVGETELNLLQIRKKHDTEVLDQLREAQGKVLEHREALGMARSELERTIVRAPVDGTVVASHVSTVGGVVRAGETLMEIVPERDHLIVEVRLRPQDVDDVTVGQETEVRISAFKQRTTPTLFGRVSHVSADVLSDPRSTEPYYVAHIEVDTRELDRLGGQRLQPGMPSEVMIKTGERTALAYLMQPLTDSFNRAWREQ